MSEKKYHIGFDLGGTKMLAVLCDENLKPILRKRRKTKGYQGKAAGVDRIIKTINDVLEMAEISIDEIKSIGIGSPGPLDPEAGIVFSSPNLNWTNVKIKEILESEFHCPSFLINDVDAGLFGEYTFGAARGSNCALGMFPGTGIGGGCIINGNIVKGKHTSAMEIGHIQVLPNGPLCGCGKRGCLEAVASRLAIASAAALAAYRGDAPALLKETGTDIKDIRSGALKRSIEAGDTSIKRIIEHAAEWMGLAIANAINLLNPDCIVLGGGLVEALHEIILPPLKNSIEKNIMAAFLNTYEIKIAELDDDAAALGAAAIAKSYTN